MTDAPRCTACGFGLIDTEATHRVPMEGVRPDHEPDFACLFHALPGDVPLAGAVDAVRRVAWRGHDEVRGIEDAS